MIDAALIDEAVHEWMGGSIPMDADTEQAGPSGPRSIRDVRKHPADTAGDARTPRSVLVDRFRSFARRAPLESGRIQRYPDHRSSHRTSGIGPGTLSHDEIKRVDRVVHLAVKQQLIPAATVQDGLSQITPESSLTWRDLAEMVPETERILQRLSADVYGFRSVLICQMSSLVLADLLTIRVPLHMWRPMFEAGLVPVVEHGAEPDPNGRVVCISSDPSSKEVRDFLETVKAFRPDVAYSDPSHIRAMMDLIAQHVPAIGAHVSMMRPKTARIDNPDLPKRAA